VSLRRMRFAALVVAWLAIIALIVLIRVAESYGSPREAKAVIMHVFGPRYGPQAIRVARCETGGTFDLWARNGQYLGLFQMGSYARRRYGHGWGYWAQAKAARRYFLASGRDWSPWSCKP
jgi:hypothetical protein